VDYAELLDKESDVLLQYLMRGENDPWMFHQPDVRAYDGTHSLLSDLLDATMAKYKRIFNLPVISPTMETLGDIVANRTTYSQANVRASIVPGKSITISADKPVFVSVQGIASGMIETIAGAPVSTVYVTPSSPVTLQLP
jgi:hypothetical protein